MWYYKIDRATDSLVLPPNPYAEVWIPISRCDHTREWWLMRKEVSMGPHPLWLVLLEQQIRIQKRAGTERTWGLGRNSTSPGERLGEGQHSLTLWPWASATRVTKNDFLLFSHPVCSTFVWSLSRLILMFYIQNRKCENRFGHPDNLFRAI